MDVGDDYSTRPDNGSWSPKRLLCNWRVRTWPQNLSVLLLRTERPPAEPQLKQLQLLFFSMPGHLHHKLNMRVCLCITGTQKGSGRLSCPFLTSQLSDCWKIIWSHVGQTWGLLGGGDLCRALGPVFQAAWEVILWWLKWRGILCAPLRDRVNWLFNNLTLLVRNVLWPLCLNFLSVFPKQ